MMPLMMIHAVISRIRAFAAAHAPTKRKLAKLAELPDTTLRNFDRPDWNPTRATIERIESVIPKDFAEQKSPRKKQVRQ